MRVVRTIAYCVLRHKDTDCLVSMYGAHQEPYNPDAWEVVQQGWTWEVDDGTIVGLCRVPPAKTREEAQEYAARFNARLGHSAPV